MVIKIPGVEGTWAATGLAGFAGVAEAGRSRPSLVLEPRAGLDIDSS